MLMKSNQKIGDASSVISPSGLMSSGKQELVVQKPWLLMEVLECWQNRKHFLFKVLLLTIFLFVLVSSPQTIVELFFQEVARKHTISQLFPPDTALDETGLSWPQMFSAISVYLLQFLYPSIWNFYLGTLLCFQFSSLQSRDCCSRGKFPTANGTFCSTWDILKDLTTASRGPCSQPLPRSAGPACLIPVLMQLVAKTPEAEVRVFSVEWKVLSIPGKEQAVTGSGPWARFQRPLVQYSGSQTFLIMGSLWPSRRCGELSTLSVGLPV